MEHITSENTRAIINWAVGIELEDIPSNVLYESKRCLLDHLGVTIGGQSERGVSIVRDEYVGSSQEGDAAILGTGLRARKTDAALINGIAAHAFDFDDTHIPTILHPTTPIYASGMVLAETESVSGLELLASHAIAYEVSARASKALYPDHYDTGWHMTGTTGTIGAFVAAARLLRLDTQKFLHGLGVASTQASGHREHFGTMTKPFHAGKAAENGLLSALLAKQGFTAASDPLEGRRGMFNVMSASHRASQLSENLGQEWQIFDNGVKPYACGVVTHPPIDAVRIAAAQWNISPDSIERIEIEVHPLVEELTGKNDPQTGLEGKFSVKFACAIAILDGAAGERQFSDANVVREDVRQLMSKIKLVVSDNMPHEQAKSTFYVKGKPPKEYKVEAATGTPGNSISDEDLEAKFMDLSTETLGEKKARALADAVWNLDKNISAHELASLAIPEKRSEYVSSH